MIRHSVIKTCFSRAFTCLLLALSWTAFGVSAQAQPYDLFTPIEARPEATDVTKALQIAGVLQPGQGLDALTPAQQAAIRAVANAETNPSMGTAVALLSHFPTFSAKENDLFRRTLAEATMPAFLMADVAKYELILRANKRIHAQEKSLGAGRGIEVSLRVGSTGGRFAQWQQWKAAGSPMQGDWTYQNPFDPTKSTVFNGMPVDDTYRDAKLMNADDDVTNWASEETRKADPLANETLNGKRAADEFSALTREILATLPEGLRAAVMGGKSSVPAADMKVEFLSPTQAVNIMADEAKRAAHGWEAPIALEQHVNFLGAWILKDLEKYNGLYAEEQLHAWGMKKGYVTQNIEDPLASGSSITYKQSATSGALKTITGSDVFPKGVKDPFGWMATNYRQIFVTHKGDLDSLAKYSERMIDWWSSVNLSPAELRALVQDTPGITAVTAADFERLDQLTRAIRNAPDADAKAAAIKNAGGRDKALADLQNLNEAMMLTGQRKHLQQQADALTAVIRDDVAKRTLGDRLEKPLTFLEIIAEANRRKSSAGKDDPYVSFLTSVNAYASGYANLPADVARKMAVDIAQFVERDLLLPGGEGQLTAELRLYLLPVLQQGAERARAVGTDLREDADGLRRFADIAESDLGAAINQKLRDLGEPDLHDYLKKLQLGQITRRQLRLMKDTADGWPRVQVVDQIWRPADIGSDLKRIMWLGKNLGWTDATFAARMAAYFNGPDYLKPSLPDAEPSSRRVYADDALDGFLAFVRLFDRASATTHFIRMTGPDGEIITKQIRGSRFADAEMNMALIVFEHTLRGSQQVAKIWGLKGDIDGLTSFAKTLHALAVGNPDQTQADKARAFATLAADAYGTFPSLVENFGSQKWADWVELNMGGKSVVLGKAGGTIGALLSNADNAFQTPEAQQALYGAMITDLLVVWQPHIATAMAVHAIYKAGDAYFADKAAKSDLVNLLARNGRWDFPTDGTPPVLEAVFLGNLIIPDNAAARKQQCSLRGKSSLAPGGKAKTTSVGVEEILRIMPAIPPQGVPLCERIKDGKCAPAKSPQNVHPREAALTLFNASGLNNTDPLIIPIKDSIDSMVGWDYFDPLRKFVTFDDGTQWTAERLATHGIYPKTPEDASFVLREPIEVTVKPADANDRPRDANTQWIHAGIWRSLGTGGRKMLGYMASEYWVRRQYLMECVMLDPWLQEAALQAQKDSYKGIDIGDVAGRLTGLDRRMRALDKKFWPQIAISYQPYPLTLDGQPFPDDQRLAIYDHYLRASANPRRDLRDLIEWFEGEQTPDNIPLGPLARAEVAINIAMGPDLSDGDGEMLRRAMLSDEQRLKEAQSILQDRVEKLLAQITDLVGKYESGFDGVTKRIGATRKYVNAADNYIITPVHVSIMDAGSFKPPDGRYGDVEKHLFPKGKWRGKDLFGEDENTLLSSLNFSDLSLAADGSVGAALRTWDIAYREVLATARDAVGENLATFKATLVKDVGAKTLVKFNDKTQGFEAMIGLPTGELATAHPLFPRILRQAFQAHKISLVVARAKRVSEPEITAVAAQLKTDGSDAKLTATAVDDLQTLATGFSATALKLIALTLDLFKIEIKAEDTGITPFVGSELKRDFLAEPHKDPEKPEITEEDLKKWISQVYWEIARKPDFNGPVQRIGLDPDRDIVFSVGVPGASDVIPPTPPLMTCNAGIRDPAYESLVAVLPAAPNEKKALTLPLVSPGVYFLRATALSSARVPLARMTTFFEVAPAELRGELIITGGDIDTAKGQKVALNVGGKPWWEYRGFEFGDPGEGIAGPVIEDVHPVVTLHNAGLFRAQLCGSLSQTMLSRDAIPPVLIPGAEAAKNLHSIAYFFPNVAPGLSEIIASDAVTTLLIEPGVFGLREPVEVVLKASDAVPVTVETVDASDRIVIVDTTIETPEGPVPGPGPVNVSLATGDDIYATAEMQVLGGVVSARSDVLGFSVADHSTGITLKPQLDAYAKGNLQVTGHFNLPESLQDLGGIAGGTIWSNLLPDQGDRVLGAQFGFTNNDPVALDNGISLEASLFATDPLETFLRATIPAGTTLPPGGQLDLGKIDVAVLIPAPTNITVVLTDWAGQRLSPVYGLKVTLDGKAMAFTGPGYEATVIFHGRSDKKTIRAEISAESGLVTEELELTADIIGDPADPRQPDPFEIRLPVYMPGSLRLTGTSEFIEAQFSDKTPGADFDVGLQSRPRIDPWHEVVGARFLFDLSFPVQVGDLLQVAGRTRIGRHSFKGFATGKAPSAAPTRPVTLDVGVVVLETFLDFIPMPNMVGMNIDKAKDQFGDDFTLHIYRNKVAPTLDEIDDIYVQAPLPHSEAKPSFVPRGLAVSLAVYGEKLRFALRDFKDFKVGTAEIILAGAHVLNVTTIPARAALEGETPGLVLRQDPPGGTLIDPEIDPVTLYYSTMAIARVVIPDDRPPPPPEEPEEPEDPPPPGEPEETVVPPQPEPEPPADGRLAITGGWTGSLRASFLKIKYAEPTLPIDITCTATDQCIRDWTRMLTKLLRTMVEEKKAAEAATANEDLTLGEAIGGIPEAIGEGIAEAMGAAILIGMAFGGIAAVDKIFTGVTYGLEINQDEDGNVSFVVPDDDGSLNTFLDLTTMTVLDNGDLNIALKDYSVDGQAVANLSIDIIKTEAGISLTMDTRLHGISEPVDIRLTLVGDLVAGTPNMTPIMPQLMDEILAFMENPDPKYEPYLLEFVKLMEELDLDSE